MSAGRLLERTEDERRRRAFIVVSLVVNLGLLGTFKYFNFFAASVGRFAAHTRVRRHPAHAAANPAGWHQLLYVPVDQLHGRRLSP
jgi:hypothetical protein